VKRNFHPDIPELMDQAVLVHGKPTLELQKDLTNLRWLNKKFGAVSLLLRFLRKWESDRPPNSSTLRILDLATGEADLPREVVAWCRKHRIEVAIDAVDTNAATLAVAMDRSRDFPEITFHEGDIRTWGTGTWDIVLCSLALHHFSQEDAVLVLRNAFNRSTSRLLVADLERNFMGVISIWLLTALLLRDPMTVHDARLSIRRSFSFRELGELAKEAGWKGFHQARFPVSRQAIWMEKTPHSTPS